MAPHWMKRWFDKRPAPIPENELQGLRLELAERDRLMAQMKSDLARLERATRQQRAEGAQAQAAQILADIARPVSQLVTQAHLLEAEKRPLQARDVLLVARRLVRSLEDHGLAFQNQVGQVERFDPDSHEPLNAGLSLQPGQPVVVRFVGVLFEGQLLVRAGVEPAEEDA